MNRRAAGMQCACFVFGANNFTDYPGEYKVD